MEAINKEITVHHLPDEIVAKILSFLNVKSLKAAALTCKKWNEISSRMDWKLILKFGSKKEIEEPWVDVIFKSNRNFKSIRCVNYIEMRNIRLMKIFEKHGGRIQKLVMDSGEFRNFIIFCDILSFMPNLKEVSIMNSNTRGRFANNFFEDHLPHLQKLGRLKLVRSDFELMKYFKKTQINSFEICPKNHSKEHDVQIFLDFLTNQNNLKCLMLQYSGHFLVELFRIPIATVNIPFKLKELYLSPYYNYETLDHSNFMNFLEFHSDTVEKLEIGYSLPDFVFEFIFAKSRRLTSLTFFSGEFPNDLSLYERLEVNPNIKILDVSNVIDTSEDALKEFFKHVPNVEMLRAGYPTDLHIVSNVLTRLTHLELCEYSPNVNQIKSQSLQSITIGGLDVIPDWKEFAADNPNLLTSMKLHHLDLPVIRVDAKVCKALRENTKHMKSLRINKESFANCQESFTDMHNFQVKKCAMKLEITISN
ncbi:CLUMA_CG005011, isoform A [Clunio marinus]|uniref:CLUMA_CG005011, isoform A n=1 Tax=Clunio marinus TaxID=568069 RepID=A0A1J1HYZ1_9DIPT|nr:CLUMA_CG005011, isoform A [Clunio marinus]